MISFISSGVVDNEMDSKKLSGRGTKFWCEVGSDRIEYHLLDLLEKKFDLAEWERAYVEPLEKTHILLETERAKIEAPFVTWWNNEHHSHYILWLQRKT